MEIEKELFVKWVKEEAARLTADTEEVESEAGRFFEQNVNPEDVLPGGKVLEGHSYAETREIQWAEKFEVVLDEGFLNIRKRLLIATPSGAEKNGNR